MRKTTGRSPRTDTRRDQTGFAPHGYISYFEHTTPPAKTKKRLSDHTGLYTYSSEPSHLVPTSVLISADHVRHYVMLSETVILEKIPV